MAKLLGIKDLLKKTSKIVKEASRKQGASKKGIRLTKEHKIKLSIVHKGKNTYTRAPEHRRKISETLKGRKLSEETRNRMSIARKNVPQRKVTCPHCGKIGGTTMYRWHFDKCKRINK